MRGGHLAKECVVVSDQTGAEVDAARHHAERGDQTHAAEQQDDLERRIGKTGFDGDRDRGKRNHAHVHSPLC
ncbi:hypothetical protein BJS_03314 [Bradyrhizobium japonicum SEMIA 5079]|nr:hypothetical protein BJS_03314 [Bradyrhizobium japonicum SEMIA 5079]